MFIFCVHFYPMQIIFQNISAFWYLPEWPYLENYWYYKLFIEMKSIIICQFELIKGKWGSRHYVNWDRKNVFHHWKFFICSMMNDRSAILSRGSLEASPTKNMLYVKPHPVEPVSEKNTMYFSKLTVLVS